tara:strand:+ start:285 stop:989 length:705 start_codon:yes stop_codon:yes gene_type:complete
MKNNISVITVTKNNPDGLNKTLKSLSNLKFPPQEIIIRDGGDDESFEIANKYTALNIRYFKGKDKGIYDAMNFAKNKVCNDFIHYLNGGDEVFGEPYEFTETPYLLPVDICLNKKSLWRDNVKFFGYGYCHQGIIFPSDHPTYDLSFQVASDLDCIAKTFEQGLDALKVKHNASVNYYIGGFSTSNNNQLDKEILSILVKNLSFMKFVYCWAYIQLKKLLPRSMRRSLKNYISN